MPPRPPERLLALPRDPLALRAMADQVFSRTAGAPLVGGNATRVLRDATENYPAWAEAIASAKTSVHVEMYIIHRDDVGRRFVAELADEGAPGRGRAGDLRLVRLRIRPIRGLFTPLIRAGGDVRVFNPPAAVERARLAAPRSPEAHRC